jgi:hypothetical protein
MALGAEYGDWKGFQAAHFFPLAYEEMWKCNNFARWITIPPTTGGSINSVQNGILLDSGTHEQFDAFLFSINPTVRIYILFFM